jgi:hypothetical protein
MTEKKPQTTRKKPATRRNPPALKADAATIRKALDELGIDRPYYTARVVGGQIELVLYGGDVVYWPPAPSSLPSPSRGRKRPGEVPPAPSPVSGEVPPEKASA